MLGGSVDGKFRLLRLLGQGGMGAVYEAERIQAGSESGAGGARTGGRSPEPHVALKLIRPELLDRGDGSSLGRFHREARAVTAIDSEHIVRTLDFGTAPESGAPYMVMELLEGEDLETVLTRVKLLRPDTALRIAAQACLGLEKAHQARVIHRDIKPANLFLARGPGSALVVKLLDFGIAKIKPEPGNMTSGLTRSGGMIGTPLYMSPEQARSSRSIDFRTDVWSLGVVLYQALSGKLPHHESRSLGDAIIAICTAPPRLVQEVAPWVPPEVAALVHRALQLDPDQRFPSAAAMLEAIRPLLASGSDLDASLVIPPGEETRNHIAVRTVSALAEIARPAEVVRPVEIVGPAEVARPAEVVVRVPGSGALDEYLNTMLSEAVAPAVSAAPAEAVAPVAPAPLEARTLTPSSSDTPAAAAPARPGSRSRALWGAGMAALLGLGAAGVYRALTPEAAPPAPGASGAAAVPSSPARRQVKLLLSPPDAAVEVDGTRVPVEAGHALFDAAPGTVHQVRIFKGERERRGEVTVTETGVSPPTMALGESPR